MAKIDELRELLVGAGHRVLDEKRLANDSGWQIRLAGGQVVNLYDKGTCVVQGKNAEVVKALLRDRAIDPGDVAPSRVFVVYGHDDQAKNDLENMLRRWGLEPIFLDQLPSEGQTLIEKLEKYRAQADFAIVLATPDDEGHRAGKADERAFRARQNVVLELGMLLATMGRPRVAILMKNVVNMERPSDIQGLIYIPFTDSVKEAILPLAKEMNKQGFHLDLAKL